MRENHVPFQRTFPSTSTALPEAMPSSMLPEPPNADFLRHQQALASQLTMTPAEILRPTLAGATTVLSHW